MTHASVTLAFDPYRNDEDYSARSPDLSNMKADDEIAPIPSNERHRLGDDAPAQLIESETAEALSESRKYLWVVLPTEVVFALELGPAGQATFRKRLAHTNLTAGSSAHSGGEVWFADERRCIFSGASSRYRPRTDAELNALLKAFIRAGFDAICMGWNYQINAPSRVYRGAIRWNS